VDILSFLVEPVRPCWVYQYAVKLRNKHLLYALMTQAVINGKDKSKNGLKESIKIPLSF